MVPKNYCMCCFSSVGLDHNDHKLTLKSQKCDLFPTSQSDAPREASSVLELHHLNLHASQATAGGKRWPSRQTELQGKLGTLGNDDEYFEHCVWHASIESKGFIYVAKNPSKHRACFHQKQSMKTTHSVIDICASTFVQGDKSFGK